MVQKRFRRNQWLIWFGGLLIIAGCSGPMTSDDTTSDTNNTDTSSTTQTNTLKIYLRNEGKKTSTGFAIGRSVIIRGRS